jgi:crotonobetainyl-CoA:carnitine CoA-transferase CaiB-like acyl-CoA transferase
VGGQRAVDLMSRILEGVRVVDFGHHIAGPLASLMLADHGADVVHIDRPGGGWCETDADAFFNRGKRRITLSLTEASDRATARELVEHSDVLVENFRPGVMDRLGLGPAEAMNSNPQLVYCSMPAFSEDDPRAAMAGWEGILAAATSNCRARPGDAPAGWDESRPTYSALPMASTSAGLLGGIAVVVALIGRERSGRGQHITSALYDAMFTLIGPAGAFPVPPGYQEPSPANTNGSGAYVCGDGRWVQFDAYVHRFLTWFAEAAGLSSWGTLLDEDVLRDAGANDELRRRLADVLKTRPAREWEVLGNSCGAAIGMVRSAKEWMATPHAHAVGTIVELRDPVFGATRMPGRLVRFDGESSADLRPREVPHSASRAAGWTKRSQPQPSQTRFSRTRARRTVASGGDLPLSGIRVIDLTSVLAGPTAGRLLAELGADVIKVSRPQKAVTSHEYLNRGKRTILLDVTSPAGLRVFWRLLESSDLVLDNFPPGTSERYGIGYRQLAARKEDIVAVSVSCCGAMGPWAPRRGYERQAQAVTGIMERVGTEPAVLGPFNLVDIGAGLLATFAAALGIYRVTTTGRGSRAETALVDSATCHQAAFMLDYEGKQPSEPRGWSALGPDPLHRFYEAGDGRWIFLGATPNERESVLQVVGASDADQAGGGASLGVVL